jgi:hypothetical protein
VAPQTSKPESDRFSPVKLPVAAAFSFLKQTRGSLSWTGGDLAATLNISGPVAKEMLAAFEAQGYVKREGKNSITTAAGYAVSNSKTPRFNPEGVREAVRRLAEWLKVVNGDKKADYRIVGAVAFGDFLEKRGTRAQAADVGIKLEPRTSSDRSPFADNKSKQAFLKHLSGRSSRLNLREYEEWMSRRSHLRLL